MYEKEVSISLKIVSRELQKIKRGETHLPLFSSIRVYQKQQDFKDCFSF
jgi:hypothetical protein